MLATRRREKIREYKQVGNNWKKKRKVWQGNFERTRVNQLRTKENESGGDCVRVDDMLKQCE